MKRRHLLATIAGQSATLCFPVATQPAVPVVGFVGFATKMADQPTLDAFRDGLRELGYVEGRTIIVESRHADGDLDRARSQIEELISRHVAVFIAPGPAAARTIQRATTTPIVAIGLPATASGNDLFASLAKPGGTVTGFSTFGEELSAKRIQILRQVLPQTEVLGILHNVTDPVFREWGEQTEASARAQGLRPMRLGLKSQSTSELAGLLQELHGAQGNTLIVIRDFLTTPLKDDICRMSLNLGIAVIAELAAFSAAGALLSYGPDFLDLFRRAAGYVDRIIKGQSVGSLPIQLPVKFEMAVNMQTARHLGIKISHELLLNADQVFE